MKKLIEATCGRVCPKLAEKDLELAELKREVERLSKENRRLTFENREHHQKRAVCIGILLEIKEDIDSALDI